MTSSWLFFVATSQIDFTFVPLLELRMLPLRESYLHYDLRTFYGKKAPAEYVLFANLRPEAMNMNM